MSRHAYTDEELLCILENSKDEEDIYSAPNMPVCRRSLDDVSSSEEESDDEGRDTIVEVWQRLFVNCQRDWGSLSYFCPIQSFNGSKF
ncbi:hypothetical protein HHI36_011562 [Cryptolaemus montrouzieri]|uniref:Uncharacterized protein n=1 Tax=Cryptolaemus montrouzieri TaxID=559131 RepID=A0ABD2MM13_9CUCU